MNKKEKQENKRRQLMMAIDYLERSQNKEYSIKGYDKTADTIKELNRQLKDLNKKWDGFYYYCVCVLGVVNQCVPIN